MENKNSNLKKSLSPFSVWALAFGCIIGWGSFINPGEKFLTKSGVAGTTIAMILGALIMIIIAFSYAYMIPKCPTAGGEFSFTKKCFGKNAAYICGWFLVAAYLTNVPMNSTAIPLIIEGIFGEGCLNWFNISYTLAGSTISLGGIVISCSVLIVFGFLNIIGVKKASFVQSVLSILLITSVFALFFGAITSKYFSFENIIPYFGFDSSKAIEAGYYSSEFDNQNIASAILATFAIAPWAYVGFDSIPQAAEEFKFSYKKVIFIMVIAILFGCFVYCSNNAISAFVIDNWPELLSTNNKPWILLVAAKKTLGTFGVILVGVGVSSAVLSGIMGFYLTSSRLMYSMAKENYLPPVFAKINEKYQTPVNALIFCILISLTGPFLGRKALGWFVDMSAIGASIGYLFTSLSTIKTIKADKDGSKIQLIFGYVGAIFSSVFIILQLVPIPGLESVHFGTESYIMFLIWIIIGLVFYIKQRKKLSNS